jgi:hypothetical protein
MQKKEETRRFESAILGMPPLKMILVHAGDEKAKRPAKKTAVPYKSQKDLENLKAVIKLIDLLSEEK